jgi:hypothetical protein
MGWVYTGSPGGAIVIATPNCANEEAGMANITSASNRKRILVKRILLILNHLARSSFDCPVLPCCCGLRGLKCGVSMQGFHRSGFKSVHYDSLFADAVIKSGKELIGSKTATKHRDTEKTRIETGSEKIRGEKTRSQEITEALSFRTPRFSSRRRNLSRHEPRALAIAPRLLALGY